VTATVAATVPARRTLPAAAIVTTAVMLALVVNLVAYAVGRQLGGSYRFTLAAGPAEVDALTVGAFTVLPLLVGLTMAALLGRRWPAVLSVALVVAPALALVTILVMTVPADLDRVSTLALASCHVVLAPVAIVALLRLRRPD
jgi:hypothetical protein